ncbi:MAG: transcriptional regulator [Micrococcaceae bacterium]|nr:transcriptional regulator [Micrococcaceae bacterium]
MTGVSAVKPSQAAPVGRRPSFFRPRNLLLILTAIFAATTIALVWYTSSLLSTFNEQTHKITNAFPAEETRPQKPVVANESNQPVTVLVLGMDSPKGANSGSQSVEAMMLVRIPADRRDVAVVSFSGDAVARIPGKGEGRLGGVLQQGGSALAVQTVESLFDCRVDHVATIDFAGFQGLTDALGGVTVKPDDLLNGQQALDFVRTHSSATGSAPTRIEHLQDYVRAVLSRVTSADVLSNPTSVAGVVSTFTPYLGVDEGLNAQELVSLGFQLRGVESSDWHFSSIPLSQVPGGSLTLSEDAVDKLRDELRTDTVGQ